MQKLRVFLFQIIEPAFASLLRKNSKITLRWRAAAPGDAGAGDRRKSVAAVRAARPLIAKNPCGADTGRNPPLGGVGVSVKFTKSVGGGFAAILAPIKAPVETLAIDRRSVELFIGGKGGGGADDCG